MTVGGQNGGMEATNMRRTVWIMIAAAVLAAGADLAVDLESAIRRETVQGDLKGAAEAYRKIAAQAASAKNREVAARALLRLALVYRKQGDAQARQTLERLVKDYSDQQQVVAEARGELARMSNGKPVLAAKLLWNRGGVSSVSRDGRLVTFEDWRAGTANIRDLETGDTRVLPYGFDASAYLFGRVGSRLSPDGRWVAFTGPEGPLPADAWGRMVLGIMHPDGTGKVTLYRTEAWPGDISPYGWTPDSKQVLCRVLPLPRGSVPDLVLISVPSGEVRTVRRISVDDSGDPAVSPDGRWIAYSVKGRVHVVSIDGATDTEITTGPGADSIAGWSPDGKHVIFTSDSSGERGVYRIAVQQGKASGAAELLRLLPGLSRVVGLDARGTLYYAEQPPLNDAYIAGLDAAGGTFTSQPVKLTQRFEGTNAAPMWSPDGNRLAWVKLRKDPFELATIEAVVIRDLATGQERDLTPQVAANLRPSPSWLTGGNSLLLGKHEQQSGYTLYKMDIATGSAVKLRGELMSKLPLYVPSWSPDGSKVYLPDRPSIHVWDSATGEEKLLFKDPMAAYVREITPSPDGASIAYVIVTPPPAGSTFMGPNYIKILDIASGQTRELVQDKPAWRRRVMTWTPDGKYLIYATYPYFYSVPGESARIWIVPASGGTPKQLGSDFRGRVLELSVSPDGKQLGFTLNTSRNELWALENFLPAATATR
jgi:Tol biopolymer transport system component